MVICSSKNISFERYWELGFETSRLSIGEIIKKTDYLLKKAVEKRLISDVPLGVFLSGGLDSSIITAYTKNYIPELNTFTVGYGKTGDEFTCAKIVADHLGTQHHEIVVKDSDIEKSFRDIVYLMDEPIMDPAMVPTFFLTKAAKKQITVALLGEGADELFAGYGGYRIAPPFIPMPKALGRWAFFKISSIFSESERRRLINSSGERPSKIFEPYMKLKTDTLNSICRFDIKEVLPNYQLMRVDRMTMANAIEARAPFLDTGMVEFAMSIPGRTKMNLKGGKVILKKMAAKILPKDVYTSKKRTFFTPIVSWLDGPMAGISNNIIENPALFDKDQLQRLSTSAKSFKDFHKLWVLITTELWYDIFIGDGQ
jgi:asparagine synthase (glutamine-hydrolysing)